MWTITLQDLGVAQAPIPREYLATALTFFRVHMPELSRDDCVSYLKGIDLHAPARMGVQQVLLQPGMELAKFRWGSSPNMVFFTKAGSSPYHLGINPAGRHFERYRVVRPAVALRSRCADFATGAGGGIQYIVPHAGSVLQLGYAGTKLQREAQPDVKLPDWF